MKNMYYKINFLIVLFTFSCCETEEVKITPKLNNLENKYPKIGDDLYLKVSDFKDIRSVAFRHKNRNLGFLDQSGMVTKVDEETIKVKMPVMYHEDVYVESFEEKIDFKLYGVIPLVTEPYYYFTKFQIINDEIAYALNEDGKMFKSVDKYQSWSEMKKNNSEEITTFYFKDENSGIIVYDNKVYATENGGESIEFLFNSPNSVKKVDIINSSKFYFLNWDGKFYKYENDNVINIYEDYNLNNLSIEDDFNDFFINKFNYEIILQTSKIKSILLKTDKTTLTLNSIYFGIYFFEDYFFSYDFIKVYKTNNNNLIKTEIATAVNLGGYQISNIIFFTEKVGIAFIITDNNSNKNFMARTEDAGLTWERVDYVKHYNFFSSGKTMIDHASVKKNSAIFISSDEKIWKYINY